MPTYPGIASYGTSGYFLAPAIATGNVPFGISETASDSNVSTATTFTFSGESFGSADSTRIVAVGISFHASSGTTNATSVTIGGVNAFQAIGAATQNSSTGDNTDIWYAPVPTGVSGTIVVNTGASCTRCLIVVWRVVGTGVTFSVGANNITNVATTVSQSITVPSGGGVIAIGDCHEASSTQSSTTLIMDVTTLTAGTSSVGGGHDTARSGSQTYDMSFSASVNDANLSLAAFSPSSIIQNWSGLNIISRWPMLDANVSGTTITDVVNAINGSAGSSVASMTGPFVGTTARNFPDNVNSGATCGVPTGFSVSADATCACWLYRTSYNATYEGSADAPRPWVWYDTVDNECLGMETSTNALGTGVTGCFALGKDSSVQEGRTSAAGLLPSNWMHLVVVFNGLTNTNSFYVNGALVSSTTGVTVAGNAGNGFGCKGVIGARPWGGGMYQLVLANVAWNSTQVLQVYNNH